MEIIPLESIINKVIEDNKPSSLDEYRKINLYKSRYLFLEEVDSDSVKEINGLIIEFNKADAELEVEKRRPIYIFINSYGGTMTDCYAVIDTIEMSKTPVYTVGIGTCYSAGGLVLMAGHKRMMYPLGSFMFHEGSTGIFGDASKVKDTMKFYETQLKQLRTFILKKTKISAEVYEQKLMNDWYLTADECLEYGIIDEIATTLY